MNNQPKLSTLRDKIEELYRQHTAYLLFHGWHHIYFVTKKAVEIAQSINANELIVESAALVHDLNYIVEPNSEPEVAKDMRKNILTQCSYTLQEIEMIESVIMEAHMRTRGENISTNGKALSDADTLFKSLPTTPILFASKYITQNKVDIQKLADKVTSEQNPLMQKGIYFYTEYASKKYLDWAKANLQMWNYVKDSLTDPDVSEMLSIAREAGAL